MYLRECGVKTKRLRVTSESKLTQHPNRLLFVIVLVLETELELEHAAAARLVLALEVETTYC